MHITVVLATYQGERFLEEQLGSLEKQTRRPDQLVVHDDGSTDRTLVLLEDFAQKAPFPVTIFPHANRLGSAANFARGFDLASADLIVPCDQDDVWFPDRIARLEAAFAAEPALEMVFTDGIVTDSTLSPLGHRLWDSCFFGPREQAHAGAGGLFEVLLRRNVVTGSTMAFTARLWQRARPLPPGVHHDEWIALIAAATGACRLLPFPTISYRSHEAQEVGAPRWSWRRLWQQGRQRMGLPQLEKERTKYRYLEKKLPSFGDRCQARDLASLREKLAFLEARRTMRSEGPPRFRAVLAEALRGRYFRYAYGWKTLLQDLFLP